VQPSKFKCQTDNCLPLVPVLLLTSR
jgi:hypothetical protein